jgi:hypothetical protein
MPTVTIHAKVRMRFPDGDIWFKVAEKTFNNLDIMKTSRVRQWVTRNFNRELKKVKRDALVIGEFYGQQTYPPYMSYSGSLTGLNGVITRREGQYD